MIDTQRGGLSPPGEGLAYPLLTEGAQLFSPRDGEVGDGLGEELAEVEAVLVQEVYGTRLEEHSRVDVVDRRFRVDEEAEGATLVLQLLLYPFEAAQANLKGEELLYTALNFLIPLFDGIIVCGPILHARCVPYI